MSSGCVVVGPSLEVFHANRAARKWFPPSDRRTGKLHFADLPKELGAAVFQVVRTGRVR